MGYINFCGKECVSQLDQLGENLLIGPLFLKYCFRFFCIFYDLANLLSGVFED